MPVITYLGAECSDIVLHTVKYSSCKHVLTLGEELIVKDNFKLVTNLNRGGPLYPK